VHSSVAKAGRLTRKMMFKTRSRYRAKSAARSDALVALGCFFIVFEDLSALIVGFVRELVAA
jgi:hypothetical protein